MTITPFPTREILVLTVGMDTRKQAVFRMAFKMYSKAQYRLLEPGESQRPQLAIVDIDGPDGIGLWDQFRAEYPELPALIVSVHPVDNSPVPVLQKPVRMENLFPQLEALRSGRPTGAPPAAPIQIRQAGAAPAASTPQPAVAPTASRPGASAPAAGGPATPEAAPGANRPAAPASSAISERLAVGIRPEDVEYFDPRQGLFGLLQMIRRDRIPATVVDAGGRKLMIVHPEENEVRLLVAEESLQQAARREQDQFRARTPQAGDEDGSGALRQLTFMALLWQVAIWSANGRLMKTLPLNMPVQLKHWPNLTRLAPIPNALRMAAFLVRSPAHPVLMAKMLQVAPADIFNFLAAAHSLDLLQLPQARPATERSESMAPPPAQPQAAPAAAKPQQGFLNRLLRKIAGL
ncbi:MAG: response regulator [Pseudomonadota bacterium]